MRIDIDKELLKAIRFDNGLCSFFNPSQLYLKKDTLCLYILDQDSNFLFVGSKVINYLKVKSIL